jgi:hypothetical protein
MCGSRQSREAAFVAKQQIDPKWKCGDQPGSGNQPARMQATNGKLRMSQDTGAGQTQADNAFRIFSQRGYAQQ